ncbi:hypothetical protein [Duganella rhizosphaerae]|uniref:hypothetical protein n=1 Tax=Duganella rhizosphaerae TaxID=2885763 RepID=UPI00403F1CBE
MNLLNRHVDIVADFPSPLGGSGAIRAGETGRVVWDEPDGDVIVEFEREVPNEGLLPNRRQAWVPRSMVAITKS